MNLNILEHQSHVCLVSYVHIFAKKFVLQYPWKEESNFMPEWKVLYLQSTCPPSTTSATLHTISFTNFQFGTTWSGRTVVLKTHSVHCVAPCFLLLSLLCFEGRHHGLQLTATDCRIRKIHGTPITGSPRTTLYSSFSCYRDLV